MKKACLLCIVLMLTVGCHKAQKSSPQKVSLKLPTSTISGLVICVMDPQTLQPIPPQPDGSWLVNAGAQLQMGLVDPVSGACQIANDGTNNQGTSSNFSIDVSQKK